MKRKALMMMVPSALQLIPYVSTTALLYLDKNKRFLLTLAAFWKGDEWPYLVWWLHTKRMLHQLSIYRRLWAIFKSLFLKKITRPFIKFSFLVPRGLFRCSNCPHEWEVFRIPVVKREEDYDEVFLGQQILQPTAAFCALMPLKSQTASCSVAPSNHCQPGDNCNVVVTSCTTLQHSIRKTT